jgi:tetratricopeptide (TPR) repeat protein
MDPNMNLAYFNLGEVSFLQKNYPEAKKRFQTFLEKNGENDLGQFKIFLCDLVGGNADAAKKVGRSFPLSASTPLRYYALAAIAFSEENEAEAIEYIRSAASIYPPGQNNAFADSFIELGWLKRLEQENFGLQDSPVISESVLRPTTSGPAGEEAKAPSFEGLLPSGEKK